MAQTKEILVLFFLFVGWYGCSFLTDTLNKQIQRKYSVPASLTFIQFAIGGLCSTLILRVFAFHPFQALTKEQVIKVIPVCLCWTLGFGTTNFSFGRTAVSFTHAVKATEPLFLVFISVVFFHGSYPTMVYMTLLPIVIGIAFVAATDANFALSGFLSVCISNCCFTTRSILSKQLFAAKVVDNINLYYYLSWLSALFILPLAIVLESQKLLADQSWMSLPMLGQIVGNGIFHFAYNQLSFVILGKVAALTHSIGNAARRFVIIMGAVLYFGTPLTALNQLGIVFLVIGVFGYAYAKSRPASIKNA
eukprot:m.191765 g.191765  ORF g.191765 m.191765 type:complete len:306 (+) comp25720_c2_seq1:203-1120(+)